MTRAGAGKRLMSPRHCNDTPNRNTRWAGDLQPRPTSKCVSHCTECVKHTHTHTHASLPPTHSTWLRNMHPHTLSTHTYHHPTLGSGVPPMAVNTRTHSDHSHIHTHTHTQPRNPHRPCSMVRAQPRMGACQRVLTHPSRLPFLSLTMALPRRCPSHR